MKTLKHVDVAKAFKEGTPIDTALRRAGREALLRHKRAGQPVVIWKNGRIARVKAETLLSRSGGKRRAG